MHGRVLVVDDDADAAGMLAERLRMTGLDARFETDPVHAIETTLAGDVEVVVTDLKMDRMDGLTLCARVTAARPDVPVVLVTGHASMDAAVGALRAGAFDFVAKPAVPEMLVLAVERALRHHRLSIELGRTRRAAADPSVLPGSVDELVSAAELEGRYVSHVLGMVKGNKSHAARILGFDRRTLYRKLERRAREQEPHEAPRLETGA